MTPAFQLIADDEDVTATLAAISHHLKILRCGPSLQPFVHRAALRWPSLRNIVAHRMLKGNVFNAAISDTLNELAAALGDNDNAMAAIIRRATLTTHNGELQTQLQRPLTRITTLVY